MNHVIDRIGRVTNRREFPWVGKKEEIETNVRETCARDASFHSFDSFSDDDDAREEGRNQSARILVTDF